MGTEHASKTPCSRRDFMGRAGVGAFLGAIGLAGVGALYGLKPSALPDPSEQFKIGPPEDFPSGTVRLFTKENVAVFSDEEGIHAISLVCTHLGCIVTFNKSTEQFDCPCHGSSFNLQGKVVKAPAPKPLEWFKVSRLPGGQLLVDRAAHVAMGTKVKV